jgi:hypothetical protein
LRGCPSEKTGELPVFKKLLLTASLLCVLTLPVLAGDTNDPGDNPNPSPTPCPETVICPDAPGVNSAPTAETSDGPWVFVFFIDGVAYVIEIP